MGRGGGIWRVFPACVLHKEHGGWMVGRWWVDGGWMVGGWWVDDGWMVGEWWVVNRLYAWLVGE